METFYLHNQNVCTRLSLFGNDVANLLKNNGWQEANLDQARYIFVNSCAFLKKTEDAVVSKISEMEASKSKDQTLVVFGCLPFINHDRLRATFSGEIIITREINEFINRFGLRAYPQEISHTLYRKLNWMSKFNKWLNETFFHNPYYEYLYSGKAFYLKIGQGCLGACSYCSEKDARGKLQSRKISEVVDQFKQGLSLGYQLMSFNGDDVGVFGWDNNENIADLLEKVLSFPEDFKLMLTEFNPWGLMKHKDRLSQILQSSKIAHITVPMQSGSNKILQLMHRNYRVEEVMAILQNVRNGNPNLVMNTHIIVGFPEETQDDFSATLAMIDKGIFDKVKIFKYSDRAGTESYSLPAKVSELEINRRYNILRRKILWQQIRKLNFKNLFLNLHFYY